jgi:hypothetical protein
MTSCRKTPTLCERDTRQLCGTNLIHSVARDVKDTLLTRKRQLTADSDSNSLIWIRHSLQASIASTHKHVHIQIAVLGSFIHYS